MERQGYSYGSSRTKLLLSAPEPPKCRCGFCHRFHDLGTGLYVFLPLVFGSLSIIFAILSKGYGKKLLISAKIGLCTAIGCISLIIVIMGTFITLFLSSSRSDMIRLGQQMDQQLEDQFGISPDEILGQSYEDIMEDFADSLGKPVSPY